MPVIPAIQKAEIRKTVIQNHPRQKVSKTASQQINQAWWCISVIPARCKAISKIVVQGAMNVIEHLPSKHKALIWNPSTITKE
jgi:hypothetical protein